MGSAKPLKIPWVGLKKLMILKEFFYRNILELQRQAILFSSAKAKYIAWSPIRNINVPSREIWGLLPERRWVGLPKSIRKTNMALQKSLYTLSNLGFRNRALLVHFRSPVSRKTENGTPSNTISDLESQPLLC